jgi:S1-C subfamily serine protease
MKKEYIKIKELRSQYLWIALTLVLVIMVYAWISVQFRSRAVSLHSATPGTTPVGQPVVRNAGESFSAAANTVKPAVVCINTVKIDNRQMDFRKAQTLEKVGSGFFVNPNGIIVTNYHVVAKANEIKVTHFERNHNHFYNARIVKLFPEIDLAIIKVEGMERFPTAALGNSDNVKVGNWVLAIGSPFGLAQSVTAGIVSATNQSLFINGTEYKNLIQTDASINPGNSGGPLVNIKGEIIGINTAISASSQMTEDLGFCIPSNKLKALLNNNGVGYIGK